MKQIPAGTSLDKAIAVLERQRFKKVDESSEKGTLRYTLSQEASEGRIETEVRLHVNGLNEISKTEVTGGFIPDREIGP